MATGRCGGFSGKHLAGWTLGLATLPPAAVLCAGVLVGCSGGDDDTSTSTGGNGGMSSGGGGSGTVPDSGGTHANGGTGAQGGTNAKGGTSGASGSAGKGSGGANGGSSAGTGAEANAPGAGGELPTGDPGCGLDAAAFCDNFDAPSKNRGRAGELDSERWSGSHMRPDGPTAGGDAFGVPAATLLPARTQNGTTSQLPPCRAGVADSVFPDDDALICDSNSNIASRHLLVAVASQNYGQNSYRIRQPFDFAGRTGKVVFDTEAVNGGLLGWVSLDITEDPIGAPSFQTQNNLEGGVLPRSGLSIQFAAGCNGQPDSVAVSEVHVFDNYADTNHSNTDPTCVTAAWGSLNHFEVSVAAGHVEVKASDASDDGSSFGSLTTLWAGDVSLPFTRGYVQITTHNHATLKYSAPGEDFGKGFTNLDAWMARWDNVGFDGPVVSNFREYEVPDPLDATKVTLGSGEMVDGRNIGFIVPDEADAPLKLEFDGVELKDVTKASIAVSAWYCAGCGSLDNVVNFKLRYRLNGGAWIDRSLNDQELTDITVGNGRGAVGHILEAPLADLVEGKNTLEMLAVNIPRSYPPGVANIDLVLATK